MDNYRDGFWRVGSPEVSDSVVDANTYEEAMNILGANIQEKPLAYHWLAYGTLDDQQDFILLIPSSFLTIN